jgi:hypothetical protein
VESLFAGGAAAGFFVLAAASVFCAGAGAGAGAVATLFTAAVSVFFGIAETSVFFGVAETSAFFGAGAAMTGFAGNFVVAGSPAGTASAPPPFACFASAIEIIRGELLVPE